LNSPWIANGPLLWTQKTIDGAPDEEGVYAILSLNDRIYMGRGRIRHRLIGHWNKTNPGDRWIWSQKPVRCCWKVCPDSGERLAELVNNYPTLCNTLLR
jgi:hypothetical protein